MFVYSRTDTEAPKHRGISYVLVDMESPGVSVTPLPNLANVITFAQEFFEDVHVPAENIIGEPNTGWQQRAGVVRYHSDLGSDSHAKHRRHIDDLIEYLRDDSNGSRSRDSDVLVRQRVARMVTDVEISNVLAWRNASLQTKGEMTLTAAESTGVYNRELTKRVAQIAIECLGLYGPLMPNDPRAKLRGWYANAYQFSLAATIYGGTVDIHRNVLATRGLGMPRELSLPRS
jgi:alkylation response protein AidB-like acyl-CoA dehydrogenase